MSFILKYRKFTNMITKKIFLQTQCPFLHPLFHFYCIQTQCTVQLNLFIYFNSQDSIVLLPYLEFSCVVQIVFFLCTLVEPERDNQSQR